MTNNHVTHSERRMRGFCPASSCGQRIEALSFRDPGGVNDDGAIVARCLGCGNQLTIDVVNPSDAHISGAETLRIVDGGCADGLPSRWRDTMTINIEAGDEPAHEASSCNLFRCDCCDAPVEALIQQAIFDGLGNVNDALSNIHQHYLKSAFAEPVFTVVRGTTRCPCDAPLAFTAFRRFQPDRPNIDAPAELLIASVEGAEAFKEIDGVFTRDECEALVTKLTHRWRLLYPSMVIATPFVGFSFGDKRKFCAIWDRLLSLIDPEFATLVTRKRTITEYRMASEAEDDVDFAMLERYGLLHRALIHYVRENRFHAKFYAAADEAGDKVEGLIGSFNFQEGVALENMTLRTYSSGEFRRRYLDKLGVPEELRTRSAPFCIVADLTGARAIARPGVLSQVLRPDAGSAEVRSSVAGLLPCGERQ